MKDNKSKQIAILERILSYAEFKKKHLQELKILADKLKKLKIMDLKNQMQKREIKFRAWDKKHNCWDDDFAIHADGCLYQPAKARWDISDIAVETAYDELEIMQFTGLKDKNGKEIYEGDIVNATYGMDKNGETTKSELRIIDFGEYSFRASSKSGETRNRLTEYFFLEVIGNIYEHSNLLNNG